MTAPSPADHGPDRPWESCVVPLLVFLAAGLLEPTPSGGGPAGLLGIPYSAYPFVYAARLVATATAIVRAWGAIRAWVGHTTWWPIAIGTLLVVPWVMLATAQREAGWAPDAVERSAFDPFAHFATPVAAWGFLFVRALGLVLVVPLVEELFLRGFLMRYVIDERFWTVPFGRLTLASAAACLVYAAATHPGEALAALAWFSVMSGIATATRRPIDVILAHAATNLALGAYVLATKSWWLL
ncbi:MAG: CPBP family glutamic-type intramembrane protease [Planctomycetia bacterium]